MQSSIADLAWLVAAPDDFSSRCRAALEGEGEIGHRLQQLATFRLSSAQALSFSRAITKARGAGRDLSPLTPTKLAITSNATMDFVADHLPAAAARHGVALEVVLADFDVVMQEALDPRSTINTAGADLVLLAVDYRWLGLSAFVPADAEAKLQAAIERLLGAARLFKANSGATPILPLLATPASPLFGSFDRLEPGTLAFQIDLINRAILDFAREEGAYVLDVAAIASSVGSAHWFDPVGWNAQKQPFAAVFNPLYADRLGSLLGAIRGKARKCLVLDLDNTLWGGAIGDEGVAGIVLGAGSAAGEAFLETQRIALTLQQRGVILAVASKNDDAVARQMFREHPDMLLGEKHIAVFQANWTDKASNLEAIANTLSIGLDALVLLDDNPAERAQLRAALPVVAVPELPSDPAHFGQIVISAGYFEAVSFSADDAIRGASYTENARRAEVMARSRDLGAYLNSLGMEFTLGPFNASNRARVTQLINKTNQFNLRTRRLTEKDVEAMQADPAVLTLQARLGDTFGDMGLISVVTCKIEGAGATVTDWLMSCRVLGRRVEEATYDALVMALSARGVEHLAASYSPTAKNSMVREHFDRLGMALVREDPDGSRHYEMAIVAHQRPDLPMKMVSGL
jgi:FkbH-like protein